MLRAFNKCVCVCGMTRSAITQTNTESEEKKKNDTATATRIYAGTRALCDDHIRMADKYDWIYAVVAVDMCLCFALCIAIFVQQSRLPLFLYVSVALDRTPQFTYAFITSIQTVMCVFVVNLCQKTCRYETTTTTTSQPQDTCGRRTRKHARRARATHDSGGGISLSALQYNAWPTSRRKRRVA